MTKEEILYAQYSALISNPEKLYRHNTNIIQAALAAMEQYAYLRALQIAGEAYDTGVSHEYNAHFGKVPNPTPDKETYISQLKTKLSQP